MDDGEGEKALALAIFVVVEEEEDAEEDDGGGRVEEEEEAGLQLLLLLPFSTAEKVEGLVVPGLPTAAAADGGAGALLVVAATATFAADDGGRVLELPLPPLVLGGFGAAFEPVGTAATGELIMGAVGCCCFCCTDCGRPFSEASDPPVVGEGLGWGMGEGAGRIETSDEKRAPALSPRHHRHSHYGSGLPLLLFRALESLCPIVSIVGRL